MAVKIDSKIKGFAVVKPEEEKKSAPQGSYRNDADRRLAIVNPPTPPSASLRWQSRPQFVEGNPCHMYMVDSPEGKFAMVVGHTPLDGDAKGVPFEVWVIGEDAPRGLSTLAKSLSIDMRSEDRVWLKRKLDALQKTNGIPFDLTMPNGKLVKARSAVAAFARLLDFRCQELGAFEPENMVNKPVMDALMSKSEPKTNGDGAVGWNVDVENFNTGDEFVVLLKECEIEGKTRPFSLWLSGDFPPALEGLAKSLSLDMRVVDPAWIARKLAQLADYKEARGEMPLGPVPGATDGKCATFPSSIAYVATAIQHRYRILGHFDGAGSSVANSGVVHLDQVRQAKAVVAEVSTVVVGGPKGRDCTTCQAIGTVVKLDGCDTCLECQASRCG